jgi:hypothetical protein
MLVASSLLLLGLLLYLMFANYLPAKQRIIGLERELKEVYAREVALQTRLAQQDTRGRDQQVTTLRAERDALARRIEELERELAAARPRDPGRR